MSKLPLGLLAGAIAGAMLAYLTEDEADSRSPQSQLQSNVRRMRAGFERARADARRPRPTALATLPAGSTAVTAPAPSFSEQLKMRWHEAVSAGKAASADKQAELRRKYLEDTHRV